MDYLKSREFEETVQRMLDMHQRSVEKSRSDEKRELLNDPIKYTQNHSHSRAVSTLAALIAGQMGLPDPVIEEVRMGGELHDVGYIAIPAGVLSKPSALTPEEYGLIKSHTVLGERIFEPLKGESMENIRTIVRNHHEAYDGSGYPDGLKGESIPLGARFVAVAESFVAIISDRRYRRGRSVEEAVAELRRCSGAQFDPIVVTAFLGSLAGNVG